MFVASFNNWFQFNKNYFIIQWSTWTLYSVDNGWCLGAKIITKEVTLTVPKLFFQNLAKCRHSSFTLKWTFLQIAQEVAKYFWLLWQENMTPIRSHCRSSRIITWVFHSFASNEAGSWIRKNHPLGDKCNWLINRRYCPLKFPVIDC